MPENDEPVDGARGAQTTNSATDLLAVAKASGTGPAFNVIIGADALRPFTWFAGAVLAINLLVAVAAVGIAIWSAVDVAVYNSNTQQQMHELDTDARLTSYWAERVEVKLDEMGAKPPPLPLLRKKTKP